MLHSSGRSKSLNRRVSTQQRDDLIFGYLEALGSPRALLVWLLYKSGQHRELVELSTDPLHYNSEIRFRVDYAASRFLAKCVGLRTGIDLAKKAVESAEQAERVCKQTNLRFRKSAVPTVRPELDSKLFRASQIIAKILGPVPDVFPDVGWSRGRTSSAFGEHVDVVRKYHSQLDVTVSARSQALRLLNASPLWGASVLEADAPCSLLSGSLHTVWGNTMITVPKSAKTDRTICYEPHMNIRLQLAVGRHIRHRLKRHGIDLDDQSINQRRARAGALLGDLATIDLSMASDTLASEVVYDLLPVDWALRLDSLRSKHTLWPDGSTRKNEKFSSMGNGFTFELESLIFYAACSAVSENVSVFGDDIIVPTGRYEDVRNVLEHLGFSINQSKSYATSYFRESCGSDYFGGTDCTPVYLRRLPKSTGDVVKLHNAIVDFLKRGPGFPDSSWETMLASWRDVHTCHLGPSGYGDGHYHVNFEVATPHRAASWIDGWWFKTWIPRFAVNTLYGGRLEGSFPSRLGYAALCASTGPKASYRIFDTTLDRRQVNYKSGRVLASFCWPGIVWV